MSGTAAKDRPTVVIGAADAATLAGIRLALEADGIHISAEATSLRDLIAAVETADPDVCLIDAELDGGIHAAAEVSDRAPRVAVVLLADDGNGDLLLDAIRVGARGYVPRHISPERLPNVVRAVTNGEAAIPRSLVTILLNHYRSRPARKHLLVPGGRGVDLTSREWEVLDLMREGLSTRQIAARLAISDVTVRRHIGMVLKKLDVPTRAEALSLLDSA